jgi:ribosomal protein S18 acetylase RimI-like enzyme
VGSYADIGIRAGHAEDVSAVLPMVVEVANLHAQFDRNRFAFRDDIAEVYRGWLRRRATDDRSLFLVAVAGSGPRERADHRGGSEERVVGFVIGEIVAEIPVYRTCEFGWVHDLWVQPSVRGRGIGRALMSEALRRFERLGVKQVRGETAAGNEAARRMLGSIGFSASTVEMTRVLSHE